MAFNNFPYTDMHELNLDWIIDKMKKIERIIDDSEKILEGVAFSSDYSGETLALNFEGVE